MSCAAVAVLEVNGQTTQRTATRPATPRMATSHATLSPDSQKALINEYCAGCHDDDGKAGGLSLNDFDPAHAETQAAVAEKIIRKLRAGMMPPPAATTRPDAATTLAFAESLENTIDAAAVRHPNPGWRPFQRLNRAEYARAVRDLLDVDVDPSAFLPPDTISNGFDNVADAQTFSPALMEGYLRAASRVTALALGDVDATPSEASYKLPKTASQLQRADGAPLGTRGGVSVVHTFAADGDYVFRMDMFAEPLGLLYGSTATGEQVEVSIDGERVALFDIDPRMSEQKSGLSLKTAPIHVKAGSARVTAAFIQRFEGPDQRSHRADRSHARRYRDRYGVRHHDAAALAIAEHRGPPARHGCVRHAESSSGLRVPADVRRDFVELRGRDRQDARDASLPRPGDR